MERQYIERDFTETLVRSKPNCKAGILKGNQLIIEYIRVDEPPFALNRILTLIRISFQMGIDSFIHHCAQFLMELLRHHINFENTWRISACIYYINNLF